MIKLAKWSLAECNNAVLYPLLHCLLKSYPKADLIIAYCVAHIPSASVCVPIHWHLASENEILIAAINQHDGNQKTDS